MDAKLRSIGVELPCCELVVVDADGRVWKRFKDLHVRRKDRWPACVQTLTVAAELAQVHDVESRVLDTGCDDVLDLLQIVFAFFY